MDRNEDGRISKTRTDREVLDAVEEHQPAGTADVAEALGVTRQAADYRLRRLREDGRVDGKKVGGSLIWTVEQRPGPQRPADTPEPTTEPNDRHTPPPEPTGLDVDDLERRVRELDIPGSGSRLDARVDAIVAIVEYLEQEGEAHTGQLKLLVDGDAVGYSSVGSFWTNVVRAKDVFKELPDVEAPGKGEKVYTYTGVEE